MKATALLFSLLVGLNVLSWVTVGRERALLVTARFYGTGNHGPEDTLLVFARYRDVPGDALQPSDFSQRTRSALLDRLTQNRGRFLRQHSAYRDSRSVVVYQDAVGEPGPGSNSVAHFVPAIETSGLMYVEASGVERLGGREIHSIWRCHYLWVFGWRSIDRSWECK